MPTANTIARLRVALLAPCPANGVAPAADIKPGRRAEHPAPWVRSLCRGLAGAPDVEVRVFSLSRAVARTTHGTLAGVPVTLLAKWLPGQLDTWFRQWLASAQLRRPLARFAPDLVVGFGTESAYGIAAVRSRAPAIVFIQGVCAAYAPYLTYRWPRTPVLIQLEHAVFRRAAGLVAETRWAETWARDHGARGALAVIPHAVDPLFLDPPTRPARPAGVLWAGSLDRRKGADLLPALFHRLPADATLDIVGDGPLAPDLRAGLAAAIAAGRVRLRGHLGRDDMKAAIAAAALVLVTSRVDTSPNIVTESHACAVPVVALATGGIPDMIDHERDGLLVPAENPSSLADATARLLADPDLARRMGAAGREKVRVLNDPDRIAAAHLAFYRTVLARRALPLP